MDEHERPPTLLHALERHAGDRPDALACAWLNDVGASVASLTYGQLWRRIGVLAGELRSRASAGDRVVLLYGPGLEFVSAFLACLAAGVVAVPAYPPRNRRHHARLDAIVHDAQPALVLVGDVGVSRVDEWLAGLTVAPRRLDTGTVVSEGVDGPDLRLPDPAGLALLQYTSGSTATPKGVMVTHANIAHNSECLRRAFHLGAHSVGVCWLPSFHDMGLIDGVLQPLYTGFPVHLMAPSTFIQRPVTWLEAIARLGGTHCGGPNFAYEACLLGVTSDQKAGLDLSRWETAYNGAEPVRRETLESFALAFQACGFRPRQFYPCYGLAEATLIVTGSEVGGDPVCFAADAARLEQHEVAPAADPADPQVRHLVGCGTPVDDLKVVIVDPLSRVPVSDAVGEVWVQGPSIAAGYWQNRSATVETFEAMTADGDGPYLRTGDLGFLREGELFVTGRIKDLVIIRGRNHYPQDIESTAGASHSTLARGQAACFSVDDGDTERLVLLQEVPRTQARTIVADEVLAAIRTAIVDGHEVDPWDIMLVPALSLPKTSSGKLQRGEARRRYLAGDFKVVARRRAALSSIPSEDRPAQPADDMAGRLRRLLARTLDLSADSIDPTRPFASFGLDSLTATRLAGQLQEELGRPVSPTLVYDYPTLNALAAYLSGQATAPSEPAAVASADAVAIVGIGCRFPGARGPEAFWRLLCDGVDAVTAVPPGRWDTDLYHPEPGRPGRFYAARGGFLDAVDTFDAAFFDIAPNEADRMDPQQRMLLETSWEAFEDAGIPVASLAGTATGVFVGLSTSDYRALQFGAPEWLDHYAGTGNAASVAANRLSYLFDFQGPSLAVDTACSSSLLAVHLAIDSLRRDECRVAIAGGVNLMLTPDLTVVFSQARMLSPDGRCKAFDAGADGYVRGEGCGMVVLKRLSDAVRDGDRVIAVIRGSAANQDGRTNGLTAPNGLSQQRVLRQALTRADVPPSTVQYVEAHGTGTSLGDPIEMHAIRAVYGDPRSHDDPLFVGSVKTNIGHLEAAAGIASLIKAAMSLRARTILPNLHFSRWNPEIALGDTPIRIPTSTAAWPDVAIPRAAVSAFGFGGTNVHVVLEAPPPELVTSDAQTEAPTRAVPLMLSARTPDALRVMAQRYRRQLEGQDRHQARNLAFTAAVGRDQFGERLGVSGRSADELCAQLDTWLAAGASSTRSVRQPARVAFLYTGQGAQYAGMAQALFAHQASRAVIDRLTDRLLRVHGIDLLPWIRDAGADGDAALARTRVTQPALYIVQCALTVLWRSWGLEPAAVIGHSVGEFAAAAAAGVFSVDDGLDLIAARGRLMEAHGLDGGMVAVSADPERIAELAVGLAIECAAVNADGQVVMAGPPDAVDALIDRCRHAGVPAARLATSHAFHTRLIEPALPGLAVAAAAVAMTAPRVPWISNLTGRLVTSAPSSEYWTAHARQPVQFRDGIRALDGLEITAGLEIGPHGVLLPLARRSSTVARAWVPSLDRHLSGDRALAAAVASLYTAGVVFDPTALFPGARQVTAPTYPFAEQRHWFEPAGQPIPRPTVSSARNAQFHDVAWEHMPFASPSVGPSLDEVAAAVSRVEPELRRRSGAEALPDALQALDSVALDWAHAAIAGLADGRLLAHRAGVSAPEDVDRDAWSEQLGVVPRHRRLTSRLMQWLVANERIVRSDAGWVVTTAPLPEGASDRVVADFPEIHSEAALVSRCGPHLGDVWRGHIDPLHLLFPDGDFGAAAAIYTDAPAAQLLNGQAAEALRAWLAGRSAGERVRILELGAGTGGLTTYLLPVLEDWGGDYEYVFTDLSPSFLEQARARFGQYRGMQYRLLDLESLGSEPAATYDLALAANAVHAVARLAPVLRGLHRVLRPGGQMWLLEGVRPQGWLDLTFGLTEGWWKAADGDGRSNYPLLSADRWQHLMRQAGFDETRELSASSAIAPYALLAASRPHHLRQDVPTRWVLAGQTSRIRDALHSRLAGGQVVDVPLTRLGEALAAPHANDTCRTHVILCLDDLRADDRHPDQMTADAVSLSAMFLDVLRTVVRHADTTLSVLTRGARPHPASAGSADRVAAASAIWGLGKTATLECPDHWGRLIDLDPNGDPEAEAGLLIDELVDVVIEDQQVWRDGLRWVPRLQPRSSVSSASGWPAARGSVLVTGGTGAMAAQAVAGLVRAGYRHFCLISRRGHPTDAVASLFNHVRGQGAIIRLVQGDVADATDIARALATIEADGYTLQGVIHAAGVAQAESLAMSTHEDLERVYRAKVQGTLALYAATRDRDLDFFVGFSSMVSVWGAKGQAVYAAGNHFLDDWAIVAARRGFPARVINWGPIAGGGMVPAAELTKVAALGVRALPLDSVPRTLAVAMAVASPQVVAVDIAWDVFRAHLEVRRSKPFFVATRQPEAVAITPTVANADELRDVIQREVAAVLGHGDPKGIDTDRGFFDIGLDSLTVVQLKTRLEERFGLVLPVTLALEYPSIDALAGFIRSLKPSTVHEAAPLPSPRPASPARTVDEPIAIVGIGCRFPGGASDPDSFWRLLRDRVDAVRPFPVHRWRDVPPFSADPDLPGTIATRMGGFLDDIDQFDADFFRLSPREASSLDPQHRLLLQVAWETLEDAGAVYPRTAGARVGVFAGVSASDYARRLSVPDAYYATGNALNAAPGRISYLFGFRGPSMAVDTACSSSLVAIRLACQSLRAGECEAALAGGVNLILSMETTQSLSRAKVLSPEGRCRAFDAAADGMARAEGCGLILLKPLSKAREDGDRIYALIRAAGINQDGASGGFTVPSREAQQDLITRTLEAAGVSPSTVDYVEAHGTGTPLGDPIEVRALAAVFSEGRPIDRPLRIGSVKTNFGHTESASGVAGVIKTALALSRHEIPPQLHFVTPSPHIDWAQIPVRVVTERTAWPVGAAGPGQGRRRLAGVSSFGLSGTNAHVVLEEAPAADGRPPASGQAVPFVLSAATAAALDVRCREIRQWLATATDEDFHHAAYTLSARRAHLAHRWAVVGADRAAVMSALSSSERPTAMTGAAPAASEAERVVGEYLRGATIDWSTYWRGREGRVISLPRYPFQPRSFWIDSPDFAPVPPAPVAPSDTTTMLDHSDVQTQVVQLVADLLQEAPSSIDVRRPFLEMGADSIILAEAVKAIERRFGVTIAIRQMFESLTTIDAVAAYIRQAGPSAVASRIETPVDRDAALASSSSVATKPLAVGPSGQDLRDLITQQFQQASQVLTQLAQQQLAALTGQSAAPAPPMPAAPTASPSPAGASTFWKQDAPARAELTPRQSAHLAALVDRYVERTRGSKNSERVDRAVFADMRTAIGFRLETKEMSYPIVAMRSEGARFWDIDGNEYVDLCMGFGVAFFGHQPSFVVQALVEQMREGVHVGPQSRHAADVARLICELTGMERVTFCNSGTEAVMTAIRVARAATGRQRIVTFTGSYHGHSDATLALAGIPGRSTSAVPMAPGVSPSSVADTIVLPYGLDKSLAALEAEAPTLAAVLVEPVQSRRPGLHPSGFLKAVRDLTRRHKVPLIFDEMITGFRVHPGGSQADFGVDADIATYGKMIGGGMPLGVVAARGDLLDRIDGGVWQYGDQSYPAVARTFYAGTFCKHPLAMAAARAVLAELKTRGPALQETLNARTRDFVASVNTIFAEEAVPLNLVHYGSLMRFNLDGNFSYLYQPLEMDVFCYHLIEHGVYVWEGRTLFLSTAHREEDLELIRAAVRAAVRAMKAGGFFAADSDPEPQPLTEAQRDLWVLHQLGTDAAAAYQESIAVDIDGALDDVLLARAVEWVARRHDALRTVIDEGGLRQSVGALQAVDCRLSDLSGDPRADQTLAAAQAAENDTVFSFDGSALWRVRAWLLPGGRSRLAVYAHHILVDGWSMGILLEELGTAYQALSLGDAPARAVPPQFGDYLTRRRQRLESPGAAAGRAYWLERFREPVLSPELPADRVRPALKTFGAHRIVRTLPEEIHAGLTTLGAAQGCSMFMTVLAGFIALQHRLSSATDVVVGVPVSGRPAADDAGVIGFCTHMVPIRVPVQPGRPFTELMSALRTIVLDAFDHQDWPLGRLLDEVKVPADLSRTPLFTTTFNLDRPLGVTHFAGRPASLVALPVRASAYDLSCSVVQDGDRMVVSWDGNTDLWSSETLERWMDQFEVLLSDACRAPATAIEDLRWMDAATERRVRYEWNDTNESLPDVRTVHEWVDRQLRASPEQPILTCAGQTRTGGALLTRIGELEAALLAKGVGPGDLVGISLPRCIDLPAALLAVWRTGAAYVPLDPSFPAARLQRMITHSGLSWIVEQTSTGAVEIVAAPAGDRSARRDTGSDDRLAYVMYTSASTGEPKGVAISHGAIINLLQSMGRRLAPSSRDTWLAVTTISFDISVLELFLPLTHGVRLLLADDRQARDGGSLVDLIAREPVTLMQATPSGWRLLLEAGWTGKPGLAMVCGGEALPPALARRLLPAGRTLWNVYGPTETTVWSTAVRVTDPERITIGAPLGNTQVYVMDTRGRCLPPGVPGELWIGGAGLALGYHRDASTTAERFVQNPLGGPSPRLYRTGDLARWTSDGRLECLGRLDHQVKVRGFRIELGEIEACLMRMPGIDTAVAHVVEREAGEPTLGVWYSSLADDGPDVSTVRRRLAAELPGYMIPTLVIPLAEMPLSANGKVDRRALAALSDRRADPASEAPPTTSTEHAIAALWREVLSIEMVARDADFLLLGGNSLLATRVVTLIRREMGVEVSLRELLEHRTVGALAALVDSRSTTRRVEIVL